MSETASPEVFALILRLLESDPRLPETFDTLRTAAETHGLLGTTADWTGQLTPSSYERAISRVGPPPPPDTLQHLLNRLVQLTRSHEPAMTLLPAAPCSLLRCGELAVAPPSSLSSTHEATLPSSGQWSTRFRPKLSASMEVCVRRRAGTYAGSSALKLSLPAAREAASASREPVES